MHPDLTVRQAAMLAKVEKIVSFSFPVLLALLGFQISSVGMGHVKEQLKHNVDCFVTCFIKLVYI